MGRALLVVLVASLAACGSSVTTGGVGGGGAGGTGTGSSSSQGAGGSTGGGGGTSTGGNGGAGGGSCVGAQECVTQDGMCIEATGQLGNGWCRGPDGACFACQCAHPDTPIATPTGRVSIASLRPGDVVYSLDHGRLVQAPILEVVQRRVYDHRVQRVVLEDGLVLEISGAHPTADGRRFSALHAGDRLDGMRILEARTVPYDQAYTYDILPRSDSGAYFTGDVAIGSTLAQPSRGQIPSSPP